MEEKLLLDFYKFYFNNNFLIEDQSLILFVLNKSNVNIFLYENHNNDFILEI